MELIYSKKYNLKQSDFRPNDTLSSHSVLDLLQDIAGDHATKMGMGFKPFIDRGLVWMIVSSKYEFYEDIPMYSELDVTTWPRKKGKLDFYRDYKIEVDGKLCVRGVSRWVIVNALTRKLYIPRDIDYNGEIHLEESVEIEKLEDFDITNLTPYEFIPRYMDLDHNGHVNNIRYAYEIENILKLKKQLKSFSISYNKESRLGDTVYIYVKQDNNIFNIKGVVNNETCFLAKLEGNE